MLSIKLFFRQFCLASLCFFVATSPLYLNAQINVSKVKPIALAVQKAQQKQTVFEVISLFEADKSIDTRTNHSEVLAQSSYATIKKTALKQLVANKPEAIQLSVPYFEDQITMDLVRVDVLSDDFKTYSSESGDQPLDYTQGVYYRGIIAGDVTSVVALSFFGDEMVGMASSDYNGNVTFNREEQSDRYLIYSDRDLKIKNPNFCSAEEPENYAEEVQKHLEDYIETRDVKCVKVYIECDYKLYLNKGTVANVNNWISAVYNNVAALYANESIVTQISTTYVWTTQDSYSTSSSSSALTQFRTARPTFNGDLAHLAALGGNNLGGVAWVNALCSSYKYAYSNIQATYQNVPTYSWTVEVMTHEMGHNLGSPHTQSCTWSGGALDNCYTTEGGCAPGPAPTNGGTIMSYCHLTSYGINFNNGFGTQPGNLIRSKVSSASCLGLCATGGSSCDVPAGLAVSGINTNSATISWTAVSGATGYQVQYRNVGGSWVVLSQQTPTTKLITGLTTGTTYEVQVRTICTSGNSNYSASVMFTTSGGASCGVPTGLSAGSITNNSANITWAAVSGATTYDLRYKLTPSGTWSTFNTTGTSVNLTSLAANTSYDVSVRANCASGSSAYSSTVSFTTTGGSTCNVPTGLAASNITSTTVTISWTAVSGAVTYDLRYKLTSSGTWTTFNTTGTAVNFTGMTAGTSYDVSVRTNCSGGSSAYSATVTFSTAGGGGNSYCVSKGNSSTYEWIDLVKLGTINNVSASNGGYGDFTALNTNLTAGSNNTITFSAGMSSTYPEYWSVWIDYNSDGDFTDAGEKITSYASSSTGNINRTFKVPTTAKNGVTRMRVQMKYNAYSTSCETFSYGEVEDYTVTIVGGSNIVSEINNTITEYTAYPNPFKDEFYVHFNAGGNIKTTITVLDANGREVLKNNVTSVIGVNEIPVGGTSNLPAGMYIVRLQGENINEAVKMIKM